MSNRGVETPPSPLAAILAGCADGALPPNVALMHIHMHTPSRAAAEKAIAEALRGSAMLEEKAAARMAALAALHRTQPDAWATVHATLDLLSESHAPTGIADIAASFDKGALAAPEASVALYSLGDPDLLAAATGEIVERLRQWTLIGPERSVLDLGCGIGRLSAPLAEECALVVGIDVSRAMLARARERCSAAFVATSGRDLAAFADCAFDLVLAADSFPYLVAASEEIAERHVEEAARVLKPGGTLAILNLSYRGDVLADRRDIACWADAAGLHVALNGVAAFSFWDGLAFRLDKPKGVS